MSETIAFYGTGLLGSGFVRNLVAHGKTVRVWNRTPEKAKALEKYGAQAFTDAAEAARGAQRVHLCVRDGDSVDAILRDALAGIDTAAPIVDHTTVVPQSVTPRAEQLSERGYTFLHAPVFMGPPNTLEATGVMLASGPRDIFDHLAPALREMTGDLRYLGERRDAAAVYKLMGNAMILAVIGGLNDVFSMAEAQRLTREQAYELFSFYNVAPQIAGRGKRMASGEYDAMWTLEMAHKDGTLMQKAAHGNTLPVVDAAVAAMSDAIAKGYGDLDLAAIAKR